jgi:hypothetical protein
MITQYPYKNKVSFSDYLQKKYPAYAKRISDVRNELDLALLDNYYREYCYLVILKEKK